MFKTLLAGALLSTGLLTGGAGAVPDNKEETSIKDKVQYAIPNQDKDGNITYKEIDKSELPKDVQVQSTEGVETDKKEEPSITDKVKFVIEDKDKDGNITYKEIDESELPKDVQVIQSTEDLINKGFKEQK
ncbi:MULTISPECIES: hypothetical protein [Bacillus cereus group]|uniref:EF-hand domain-containing protein n=1 Tax=Bacillus cereus TaxID=1396 RepID=A0A2A8U2Y9_BACCE|nr:hypothetical protein [Bacillus cereus]PDY75537.1 hypothetical protein CON06_30340 [Bacillus cereus]PFA12473.1 hypothetical protein CN382_16100 [Bacillus cereus]PFM38934.1 hypothetical protein COJ43_15880 [Bacillus cereus]PGL56825.1 hypothetical protein CN927_26670 [Bacillus cereus]PGQ04593.1 hypothetical protein COA08_29765 [Bacillus cereus]